MPVKYYHATHYTKVEGGNLLPWYRGRIPAEDLRKSTGRYHTTPICGEQVHSLLIMGNDNKVLWRWDCINGVTDESSKQW